MKNRSPLLLFYDCESAEGRTDADIVEIAIRPLLFTDKVFHSFISTKEKLSRFSKFSFFCDIFRKMKIKANRLNNVYIMD